MVSEGVMFAGIKMKNEPAHITSSLILTFQSKLLLIKYILICLDVS